MLLSWVRSMRMKILNYSSGLKHVAKRAIVPDTSNIPQNHVGSWMLRFEFLVILK